MRLIKLAAAVLNTTPLDWDGNKAAILAAIDDARRQGVSLLCLPELCVSGYGCEDAFHSPGTIAMAWRVLREIIPATKGMIVSLGLPVLYQNGLFNCACLAVDGEIVGFVAKRFLAGDGIHYEPRWFKPWPPGVTAALTMDGRDYPIGDQFFDVGGVKIGFEICEDAWVANRPGGEPGAGRRGRDPQPQRQPLRVREDRRAQAVRARGLAGVRRHVRLQQPRSATRPGGRFTTAGR